MTNSPYIDCALQIAIRAGNSVQEISEGWSKVDQVVHMRITLTNDVLAEVLRQVPTLRYWSSKGTPHNPAEEGFICDLHKVGMSFPCR